MIDRRLYTFAVSAFWSGVAHLLRGLNPQGPPPYGGQTLSLVHVPLRVACVTASLLSLAAFANGQSTIVSWGSNANGQLNVPSLPSGVSYVKVMAGFGHMAGILSDGRALAWGLNAYGECNVPTLPGGVSYVGIDAAWGFTIANRSDGSAVAWGGNTQGECNVPPLPPGLHYVETVGGENFSLARLSDGTVIGWGYNPWSQCIAPVLPPSMRYVQVAAGNYHGIARRSDGSVVAWGNGGSGQVGVPALPLGLTYTDIAAGAEHSLALRSDGSILAWGQNNHGQCNVPSLPIGIRYTDVAAGHHHSIGLRSDGSVVAWGDNGAGQCAVPALPAATAYVAVEGGFAFSVAVRESTTLQGAVAFETFGSALSAEASWSTPLLYFPPSSTCNALNGGASWQLGSNPLLLDAWSPMGNHGNDNYIAWTFHGGSRSVHAMQLLNNYDPALAAINGPHYLLHFSLDYTTDPTPSLQTSTWLPLSGLSTSVAGATIVGNEVAYPTVGYPNLSDLRVYFQSANATAVRLHSYPNGGSNLNYVLTEVAFATSVPGLQLAGTSTPGCTGLVRLTTNGPPTLGDAAFAWQCANAPISGFGALILSLFPLQSAIPIQGVNVYLLPFNVVSLITLATDWGTAATPLSLPSSPAYLGLGISGQYLWFDPCGAQGITSSNAGRIVLQ